MNIEKYAQMLGMSSAQIQEFQEFREKYQAMKAKAAAVEASKLRPTDSRDDDGETGPLGLPKRYDPRYKVNFILAPPRTDDMSTRHREEFSDARMALHMFLDFQQKRSAAKLQQARRERENLPIFAYRDQIVSALRGHQVVVVSGATGCGKSTQVPQFLLRAGYNKIICTQPRRIAAVSLCRRVAHETLNEYGETVGYQIRFTASRNKATRILFATEGVLVRQMNSDPDLRQYSVIVADEVHERHLSTDLLLTLLRDLVTRRPDLKVVLMSATLNVDTLSTYFHGAPVIDVPGRLYPIEIKYMPPPQENLDDDEDTKGCKRIKRKQKFDPSPYLRVLNDVDTHTPSTERGDVLVFLPGAYEIETLADALRPYAEETKKWVILPLHSSLTAAEQDRVFDLPPTGCRKVILSTNVAETSITIDGVRFVVDSGKAKEMGHDRTTSIHALQEGKISRANAEQRKGRAGRTGPGVCYRLYSEQAFEKMAAYPTAEIHRVPLEPLMLDVISMNLQPLKLVLPEPPSSSHLHAAIAALRVHGAVTGSDMELQLTPLGRVLARLPVDVNIGKTLIIAASLNAAAAVLPVAAGLAVPSPFAKSLASVSSGGGDGGATTSLTGRRDLESTHGDAITLLNVFTSWLAVKAQRQQTRAWTKQHGVIEQRLYEMVKLKDQFAELLADVGLISPEDAEDLVKSRAKRMHERDVRAKVTDLQMRPRKRRMLRMHGHGGGDGSGDEQEKEMDDAMALEFQLTHSAADSAKAADALQLAKDERLLVAFSVCAGLYPSVAIGDESNGKRKDSEMTFHTSHVSYIAMHPGSVFASSPDMLQENDALFFVSLLETQKQYIVNATAAPALHTLTLLAHRIDTSKDCSRLIIDGWLLITLEDERHASALLRVAQHIRLLMTAVLTKALQSDALPTVVQSYMYDPLEGSHIPQYIRDLASDAVEISDHLSILVSELRQRLAAYLSTGLKYKVSRIKPSERIGQFFVDESRLQPPAATGDIHDITDPNEVLVAVQGTRVTEWLVYGSVRDEMNPAAVSQFIQKHWTCTKCKQNFIFTGEEIKQHLSTCNGENDPNPAVYQMDTEQPSTAD